MKVLILDGYNLLHRARSGFTKGEWPVVYNFFRSLRPLIEKFNPVRCYFVLEGQPKRNLELLPSYKGSRDVDPVKDPKKHAKLVEFHRQKGRIITMMMFDVPGIRVIQHLDYEADDVMAELARSRHAQDDVTIVSGDSDMIQVLQTCDNVKLYHPIQKKFVEAPEYDYVTWKALCGDATDDIPGLPKVGAKTAEKLVCDGNLMEARFEQRAGEREIFERNLELVRLHRVDLDNAIERVAGGNWCSVKLRFEEMGFNSMLKDKTWAKYKATFECLN